MIEASFHQSVPSPRVGSMRYETMYVRMIETIDVIHTSEVSGVSKSISSESLYFALAMAVLRKYAPALESSIPTRITKIQTSSCA